MNRDQARSLLRTALADENAEFRDGQWEAISLVVNDRRKVLVVERTGWGKSSVYFISTRILRDRGAGPTLIVSPLLALMRNQIDAAIRLGIRAASINSTNRKIGMRFNGKFSPAVSMRYSSHQSGWRMMASSMRSCCHSRTASVFSWSTRHTASPIGDTTFGRTTADW